MENYTAPLNKTVSTTPATMKSIQSLSVAATTTFIAIKVVMIVLILSGNTIVIVIYSRSREVRKQSHNVFVVALAITDLLCGIITLPGDIFKNFLTNYYDPDEPIPWYYRNKVLCLALLHSLLQPLIWSVATLVAISTERFIAVIWPHGRKKFFSRSRAVLMVLIFWALFSIPLIGSTIKAELETYNENKRCTSGGQFDKGWEASVFWIMSLIPITIAVIQYGVIFLKLRHQRKRVMPQEIVNRNKREYRITRGMALILVFFVVCLLPYYLLDVLIDLTRYAESHVRSGIIYVCVSLWHANSFINPIIYAFVNESFKAYLKEMFTFPSFFRPTTAAMNVT